MRLDALASLRFFAALSVFLHHTKPFGVDYGAALGGIDLGIAVSFFFVLSGFVLSFSNDRKGFSSQQIGQFLIERLVRLWPLHMFCGAVFLLSFPVDGTVLQYVLYVGLLQSWSPGYSTAFFLNAVSWTISVELFFYLLFPFVFLAGQRWIVGIAVVWTAAVAALMMAASWAPGLFPFSDPPAHLLDPGITEASFFHLFPPIRVPEFLAGMVAYQVYKRMALSTTAATLLQIVALLALLLVFGNYGSLSALVDASLPTVFATEFVHSGSWPLFVFVVLAFAYQNGKLAQWISQKPLIYFGEISFSFYMIHQIIISNLAQRFGLYNSDTPHIWTVCAFVLSLAASAALYRWVELPPMRFIKSRFAKKT